MSLYIKSTNRNTFFSFFFQSCNFIHDPTTELFLRQESSWSTELGHQWFLTMGYLTFKKTNKQKQLLLLLVNLFFLLFNPTWLYSRRFFQKTKSALKCVIYLPIAICVLYFTAPSLKWVPKQVCILKSKRRHLHSVASFLM